MSLKQLAEVLNRDRNTVMKYLGQGMPVVERADRDRGISWVIDSSEAIRWLEERAAKSVADRLGGDVKSLSKDDAERRDAVAKMIVREVDAAESAKMVAKISSMLDLIRRDYAELRLRLMSIPDTIAGKVDAKLSAKVRDVAEEQIRAALKALIADTEVDDGSKE
ncbi:terminase small subunit [Rhizobium sp. 268]|uniref:terminase small subunit n=1 Tax=Rhizobium sp. 268 TaxID=2996375 RepID=UPI002F95DD97